VTNLPEKPKGSPPPSARLTNEQFEMVIRRAVELQARSADETGAEGVTEEEALRIGRELGLSRTYVGQALAEVQSGAVPEEGLAARIMGGSRHSASRVVTGEAPQVAMALEKYLVEREYLVVQRRYRDRTAFVRASGVVAAVARTTTGIFRRSPLLEVESLDVSVRALEPGYVAVLLATDLKGERTGYLLGGSALGGVMGGVGAVTLGIAVAPAAALIGLPILAAGIGGMRYAYRESVKKVQVQLESLLDRLEHGELGKP
jgi:hypothetical protein